MTVSGSGRRRAVSSLSDYNKHRILVHVSGLKLGGDIHIISDEQFIESIVALALFSLLALDPALSSKGLEIHM